MAESRRQTDIIIKRTWRFNESNTVERFQVVNGRTVWATGVRPIYDRKSRYCFYFVSKCDRDSGYYVENIDFTCRSYGTYLMELPLVGNYDTTKIFAIGLSSFQECKLNLEITVTKLGREKPDQHLSELWSWAVNNQDTDIEFLVGNQVIPAHKLIVKLRSPVFRVMFGNDMEEARTNRVKITDADPTVFRQFLHFLYTGTFDCENVDEISTLANKYQVDSLISLCKNLEDRNLGREDAADELARLMSSSTIKINELQLPHKFKSRATICIDCL